MKAYGGGFDPTDKRPRVAVLLAGLGLSRTNSDDAIKRTPPGVTLAFSPYAVAPDVDQARSRGHEIVLSIPMEPAGYPLEDEGPQALLTGASTEANQRRLEWSLSRFQGYAGTTGALGELRGERFARSEDQMAHTLSDLTMRGLYYIDPRVSTMPGRDMVRGVDLSFDDGGQSPSIDASLDALTKLATRRGTALGLVGSPRPVNVEHIAAWAGRLDAAGVVLVPVSALLALNTAQLPSIRAAQ